MLPKIPMKSAGLIIESYILILKSVLTVSEFINALRLSSFVYFLSYPAGCREERISTTLKNEMHTMILVEVGWPTRPDRYACDTSKNYSDANHNMYCFVNRPCHCVQDFACSDPSTPDLLPSWSKLQFCITCLFVYLTTQMSKYMSIA